jgi:CBS domain-containing protein
MPSSKAMSLDTYEGRLMNHSGDKPLTAALEIINNEGITSLPVLDYQRNVVGNISHVDVRVSLRLCTKDTAYIN